MNSRFPRWISGPAAAVLLLAFVGGCERPVPTTVEDVQLGIHIVFPGTPRKARHFEITPYSDEEGIDYFGYQYFARNRLDEHFHVEVGNLPKGARLGEPIFPRVPKGAPRPAPIGVMTVRKVLDVFEGQLRERLGSIAREELPASLGPGFRYTAKGATGYHIEGVLILRGWRLHHVQATVKRADDPRLKPFLDSLRILPGA